MTIHPLAHRERKKTPMTPTKKIALSFLAVIIIGAILLSSPIANKGAVAPIIDNLFIAVSAVCVTGLAPITLIDTYNLFGQIVIMFLIQIGGLGFITFLYLVLHVSRRQISLKSKMVFTEALNQESFRKLPIILKTIFAYTFIVEGIAAILLSIVFVP
ncbi:MAG TPA: potassium uptake protein, partial [Kandleria vitulina]|nr:potassium uptake protein [Kandleria vitulina]